MRERCVSGQVGIRRHTPDWAPCRVALTWDFSTTWHRPGPPGADSIPLALRVAHGLRERFPDGQLYVDLRGADRTAAADPAEVLAGFLRGLGVDGPAVPADAGERAALYRSLLAGRRVLVLLDNAADEDQVRALLPGSAPGCAVLVTARYRLAGAGPHTLVELPLLDEASALGLLGRIAGAERVTAEAEAARELVRLCGRLPLALRIVGAELAGLPHRDLARLAARLGDERSRLDVLDGVRAGLRLGYRSLPGDARALLRGLAALDAPDFAAWTAAAVLDGPLDTTEEVLDALAAAHLLEVAGRDEAGQLRYRMHDLVRAFGRDLAGAEEAATRRVLSYWVALVREGRRAHQGVDYPGLGAAPPPGYRTRRCSPGRGPAHSPPDSAGGTPSAASARCCSRAASRNTPWRYCARRWRWRSRAGPPGRGCACCAGSPTHSGRWAAWTRRRPGSGRSWPTPWAPVIWRGRARPGSGWAGSPWTAGIRPGLCGTCARRTSWAGARGRASYGSWRWSRWRVPCSPRGTRRRPGPCWRRPWRAAAG